jgi:hypothetical protein
LGCGNNQTKSYRWTRYRFWRYKIVEILFKFIAYEREGLENVVGVAGDGDNSLGTASIADIYFRPTLAVIVLKITPRETS